MNATTRRYGTGIILAASMLTAAGCTNSASDRTSPVTTQSESRARAAAESALRVSGFSRQGLIDYLSSRDGGGHVRADATKAVDDLHRDWDGEAARSARMYAEYMPMSCQNLIDQLASSAGDKYTKAQATYGAHQTKACAG